MPLIPFQREVAQLLAAHRNPDSYVAGGAVLNRSDASPRFSADLDIFHDADDRVRTSAEADAATLLGHGFAVEWLLQRSGLHRAQVSRGDESLKLEWCRDSSFRFFPV